MALVESGQCKITHLNQRGLGVGHTDLGEVVLPYTLADELVSFERHKYRRESNCLLKSVVVPSIRRASPACDYFGACGGCLLQHLNDEDYLAFKMGIVKKLLPHDANIKDIITVPPGQRRRANLEAVKKNDKLFMGFHRFQSHQIIDLEKCPALSLSLSALLVPLKLVLNEIMEDRQKAHLFITEASNGIDISLSISELSILSEQQRNALLSFAKKYDILRLVFRYRKTMDVIQEIAKPYVLFDKVAVEIDAQSFLQSSFLSDEILTKTVLKFINETKNGNEIVDLFCGRGTFTIPLSRDFSVDGFESDKAACVALENAANSANLSINLKLRDLFTEPLEIMELNKYKAAVINPPRAGADAQCNMLKMSNIERICYISCNPTTFARDIATLSRGGYRLLEVTPIDQFYWSPHLELVGYLSKV